MVTGGASGIGRAMVARFAAAGMNVVVGDIEPGDGDFLAVQCDVTSPDSMTTLREAAIDAFGAVHVVCLNAGVAASGPVIDTPLSTWQWLFDVNVFGIVNGLHAFAPPLVAQGEGHLVLTASAAGLITAPALGAYAATKHAVVGMAAVLRDEVASAGIGVSVICPGVIRTRIFESERNRPDVQAGPTHLDIEQAAVYTDAAANAPGPEVVAAAVHDAVVADRFFVLPSPEVNFMIEARHDAVRAAMPR